MSTSQSLVKVLIVGQTPPPIHGQAIIIDQLVNAKYERLRIIHQRLAFSETMAEVGRFNYRKLLSLIQVIAGIVYKRFRHGVDVLYYPPAGPHSVPLIRDVAILLCTRWLFRSTIFHFHAGGVSDLVPRLPTPLRWLSRWAYRSADCAIQLSNLNPPDGDALGAKRTLVIPYGIKDESSGYQHREPASSSPPTVLFVGALLEAKGVLVLLKACCMLRAAGVSHRVRFMGEFHDADFRERVFEFIQANHLANSVDFIGVRTGAGKWSEFAKADVFCFPSFYDCETFGIVLLEAMQFGLPVVATRWRGIPSVVEDRETGLLVPVNDPQAVADSLRRLLADHELAREMGAAGRRRFVAEFTIGRCLQRFEHACLAASGEELPGEFAA